MPQKISRYTLFTLNSPLHSTGQLTARICVEEEHRSPENGPKHFVVEDSSGIVTDQVEEASSQQVEDNDSKDQETIDEQPRGVIASEGV